MYVVYGLEDPRDNNIFYIGMTSDMYARFVQHIRCEENNESKNERIHQMKAIGLLPIPRTLETMNTINRAKEREQYWIAHYAYLGMPLTNEIRPAMLKRLKEASGTRCVTISKPVPVPVAVTLTENVDALIQRVMQLQAEGMNKPEIMRQVWGVSPGASTAYTQANAEYQHIMKLAYERLGA